MMVSISDLVAVIIFFIPILLSMFANICIKVGEHVDSKSEKLFYVFMIFAVSLLIGILIVPIIIWGSSIDPTMIIYPFEQGTQL